MSTYLPLFYHISFGFLALLPCKQSGRPKCCKHSKIILISLFELSSMSLKLSQVGLRAKAKYPLYEAPLCARSVFRSQTASPCCAMCFTKESFPCFVQQGQKQGKTEFFMVAELQEMQENQGLSENRIDKLEFILFFFALNMELTIFLLKVFYAKPCLFQYVNDGI